MLQRDKYIQDTIFKYMPDFSVQKYQQHITTMIKPFRKLIFNQQQGQRWTSRINMINNVVTILFTVSLIPAIFYKKMPILKKYTSKKARVLWTLGLLFIPTNIANYYFSSKVQAEIMQSYAINQLDFMRYRQLGDVTVMNPTLQFTEF